MRVKQIIETIKRDGVRAWRSGAGFIAISRWTSAFMGILRRIVLARILGAENIGHIAVLNAVMSLVRLPAGAGIFPVVTKLVAENQGNPDAQKEVIGTAVRINLVASGIVIAGVWGMLTFTDLIRDPIAKSLVYVLAVFVPIMISSGLFRCGLMGQRKIKSVGLIDTIVTVTGAATAIGMAWLWTLTGWFYSQILVIFIECVLFIWFIRSILSFRWNRGIASRLATIGGFSFATQLLSVLVLQFDTLTVSGVLKDPVATGVYNTAVLAVQQLMHFPGSILVVVFPFVAQHSDDMPRLRERYGELQKKLFIMTLAVCAVAWVGCPWFFVIFGPEFSASVGPFRVLIFGLIARVLYVLDGIYLEALGRTDVLLVAVSVFTAIFVGMNLFLIPRYGLMGAAWASTVSMFVGFLIRNICVRYFIFHKQAIR